VNSCPESGSQKKTAFRRMMKKIFIQI